MLRPFDFNRTNDAMADLCTAGVVGSVLTSLGTLPPGLETLALLGIPILGCIYNHQRRMSTGRLEEKTKDKVIRLFEDIRVQMQQRNLDDLSRFVGMNFSTEMYSTIEEIVREGVNAKSQWVRHMIASVLVTVGSVEHDFKDLYRYLRILQELDDLDTELLLLHIHSQRSHEVHQSYEMSREQYSRLKDGLLYVLRLNLIE